jgi:hypothetical protein
LDAVGVIHQAPIMSTENQWHKINRPIYFNSSNNSIHVLSNRMSADDPKQNQLTIYNLTGQLCFTTSISTANTIIGDSIQIPLNLSTGSYIAQFQNYSIKIILTDNR